MQIKDILQRTDKLPNVPDVVRELIQLLNDPTAKYQEISDTLGITEVNARVKMNRVKGKLRKILNP